MDNTDPYKTKFKEERLYMSTNQNLMQHMRELIDRIKAADVAYALSLLAHIVVSAKCKSTGTEAGTVQ